LTGQLTAKDTQINELMKQNAALTEKLLKENPSVGPGAQQAVGAAVQSIAQGAEEGDPRLKEALGLLKENKLAEAAQLLKVVAEDKTARAEKAVAQAEKDRKEAVIAYRNLGAIAGLANPKRALEAYEKGLRSIRTISRACIGRAPFRSVTAISTRRKSGLNACRSLHEAASKNSTNMLQWAPLAISSNGAATLAARCSLISAPSPSSLAWRNLSPTMRDGRAISR
jgi:hypothetical protein